MLYSAVQWPDRFLTGSDPATVLHCTALLQDNIYITLHYWVVFYSTLHYWVVFYKTGYWVVFYATEFWVVRYTAIHYSVVF